MKKVILALGILLASFGMVQAQETLNYKPIIVTSVLALSPILYSNDQLSFGHSLELEGFSYAETSLIAQILPKEFDFLAPICSVSLNVLYRLGEMNSSNVDLVKRKMIADTMGIVSWSVLKFNF